MNKNEILNMLAEEATTLVKEQAAAMLSKISAEDLRPLVQAQIKAIIEPLQKEIETTPSIWVKIRNRIYIRVINSAVDNVIAMIQDGLTELSHK
ncbi:MAG: hypothetical protein E6330_04840 [Dialister sp.]|nr:hypothetical protein [Dialister sp.]